MPHLFRIDASSRQEGSHGRALADTVETSWRAAHPSGTVTTRNVTDGAIPILSANTIAGFYGPEDCTFTGLAAPNRAILCLAYEAEGYGPGGALAEADFLAPYLQFLMRFLGIEDVRIVSIEQTAADPATLAPNLAAAEDAARAAA